MTITKRYLAPLFVATTLVFAGAACGDSGGSASAFCETLKKFNEDASVEDADLSDEESMQQAVDAFEELEANAPAEIKSDVEAVANAMTALVDIDITDPEAAQAAAESVDEEKLDEASQNIEKYAEENCDIDLNE